MSNQFLKLRRSAIPGRIPTTSSLDFGEVALNTYDGLAFMKKSGSNGEEVVPIGITSGSFTGSFYGTASYAETASYLDGDVSRIASGYVTASVDSIDIFKVEVEQNKVLSFENTNTLAGTQFRLYDVVSGSTGTSVLDSLIKEPNSFVLLFNLANPINGEYRNHNFLVGQLSYFTLYNFLEEGGYINNYQGLYKDNSIFSISLLDNTSPFTHILSTTGSFKVNTSYETTTVNSLDVNSNYIKLNYNLEGTESTALFAQPDWFVIYNTVSCSFGYYNIGTFTISKDEFFKNITVTSGSDNTILGTYEQFSVRNNTLTLRSTNFTENTVYNYDSLVKDDNEFKLYLTTLDTGSNTYNSSQLLQLDKDNFTVYRVYDNGNSNDFSIRKTIDRFEVRNYTTQSNGSSFSDNVVEVTNNYFVTRGFVKESNNNWSAYDTLTNDNDRLNKYIILQNDNGGWGSNAALEVGYNYFYYYSQKKINGSWTNFANLSFTPENGLYTIGDVDNAYSGSYFQIDDFNNRFSFVGGHISASAITSSLYGTSSYADKALTSSYALTATSSSFATNAGSSSYALTASYANIATTASYAETASLETIVQTSSGSFVKILLDTKGRVIGNTNVVASDITGALGYTPVTDGRTLTINGTTYDLSADRSWTISSSSGANPSANIGLTTINGSASTFMLSDAAPALDQSISPTWTGLHTFNRSATSSAGTAKGTVVQHTLTASANNDLLIAVDIAPSYSASSYTGVTNIASRMDGDVWITPQNASSTWKIKNGQINYDWGSTIYLANAMASVGLKAGAGFNGTNRLIVNPDGSTWNLGTLTVGGSTNVGSAVLNVESTTKGFLPPRMTTTQRNAIVSPAEGLVIYNTTTKTYDTYDGTTWIGGFTKQNYGTNNINLITPTSTPTTTDRAINIGYNNTVNQTVGIVVGSSSTVTGTGGVAIGFSASAANGLSIAMNGQGVSSTGSGIAIGQAVTAGNGDVVIADAVGLTANVYFGAGKQSNLAGKSYTINGTGGSGTNNAGGDLTIAGGKGTGTGTTGDVIFSTATLGTTGSTLQSLTQRWFVKGNTGTLSNVSTPQTNALLDLQSTSKGLKLPVMTTSERDAVTWVTGDKGMVIINSTTSNVQWWDGATWNNL